MAKNDMNIGNLTVDVKLAIDYNTMIACLKLVELYLNTHDEDELIITNTEPGNWGLAVIERGE